MSIVLLRKALQQLGECRLVVRGNSMEPSIKDGDTVIIRAKPFSSIAPGDVIAYQSGSSVLVHRVVHLSNKVAYAAGDANILIDSQPITPHNFIGKVEQVRYQSEEAERPIPKYKRNCMSLVNRRNMQSRNGQPITIWLPKHLIDYSPLPFNNRGRIRYKIFRDPPPELLSGTIRSVSVGISPWGLYSEKCLRALLPRINHVYFMANFGPEGGGYFPATRLLATMRLDPYQFPRTAQEVLSWIPESLFYMIELIEGAQDGIRGNKL